MSTLLNNSSLSAPTPAESPTDLPGEDRARDRPQIPCFLTYEHLRAIIPYTRQHLGRLERAGRFPRRVALGPGRVAWPENEIRAWIEARKAERGGRAG